MNRRRLKKRRYGLSDITYSFFEKVTSRIGGGGGGGGRGGHCIFLPEFFF